MDQPEVRVYAERCFQSCSGDDELLSSKNNTLESRDLSPDYIFRARTAPYFGAVPCSPTMVPPSKERRGRVTRKAFCSVLMTRGVGVVPRPESAFRSLMRFRFAASARGGCAVS